MKKIITLLLFIISYSGYCQTTSWATQSNGSLVVTSPATYTVLTSFTEKVLTLPMKTGGSPYVFKCVYSIALPTLPSGSILQISGGGEVTNNYSYNVGRGAFVLIGNTDTTSYTYSGNGSVLITPANGEDIINFGTSGHNHSEMNRSISYTTVSTLTGKYLNYCWYAYSSDATTGEAADVMQGYGWLVATIIRGQ